jgi:hypothetical protein
VEELSRWCGRCGTELRSGARFCSRCGQRVIDEEPAAGALGTVTGTGSAPVEGSGPGFTKVGSQLEAAAPASASASGLDALFGAPPVAPEEPSPPAPSPEIPPPAAATPPRDDWSDWYADTTPRSPFQPPANQPPAGPPPAYPPPAYRQPAYQQPVAPSPSPSYPQPQRSPFEQPRGTLPPEAAGWPMGPGGPGGPFAPAGPGGPSERDRRSRAPLFWSVLSVAVVAVVVVFLFLLHPFSHHETVNDAANSTGTATPASAASTSSPASSATVSASQSASAPASASASVSVSSTAVTEQQAASTVAGLLASSVPDRTAIDNAYNDVDNCGPNVGSDAAVFTRAASSRRALLASLAAMPGRSTLPPAVLSDLANAWQASIAADQGFATWANDEATQGCVRDDTNDPGYQATITPDNEATQYKTAFVAQWNPIAANYGLTTYQQTQL